MAVLVGLAMLAIQVGDSNTGTGPPVVAEVEPEVVSTTPPRDSIDLRLECIAWGESRNNPLAFNRISGASGLLQFLPSTWRSTPQGRAGMSIWDAVAQWAAGRWMINQGRVREWSVVRVGLC